MSVSVRVSVRVWVRVWVWVRARLIPCVSSSNPPLVPMYMWAHMYICMCRRPVYELLSRTHRSWLHGSADSSTALSPSVVAELGLVRGAFSGAGGAFATRSSHLPGKDLMGLRAGAHEGRVGPRAGGLEAHIELRAGAHEGRVGPRAGGFYPRLVPLSEVLD